METIIKENIKRFVSENDTTLSAVARSVGISRSALYEKLDGKRPWLLVEIIRLAELMGCQEKDIWTPQEVS